MRATIRPATAKGKTDSKTRLEGVSPEPQPGHCVLQWGPHAERRCPPVTDPSAGLNQLPK